MTAAPDLPIGPFSSRGAWEAWLAEHHRDSIGLWLKISKKGSGIHSVTYAEALEVALSHGWPQAIPPLETFSIGVRII